MNISLAGGIAKMGRRHGSFRCEYPIWCQAILSIVTAIALSFSDDGSRLEQLREVCVG